MVMMSWNISTPNSNPEQQGCLQSHKFGHCPRCISWWLIVKTTPCKQGQCSYQAHECWVDAKTKTSCLGGFGSSEFLINISVERCRSCLFTGYSSPFSVLQNISSLGSQQAQMNVFYGIYANAEPDKCLVDHPGSHLITRSLKILKVHMKTGTKNRFSHLESRWITANSNEDVGKAT